MENDRGKEKKTVGALRFQDWRKTHYACRKPAYFHGDVNTAVFQKVAPVFPKPAQHPPVALFFSLIPSLVGSFGFKQAVGKTRPLLADSDRAHTVHPSCALTGGSGGREVEGNPDLGASPTSLSQGSLNRWLLF